MAGIAIGFGAVMITLVIRLLCAKTEEIKNKINKVPSAYDDDSW